MKDLKEAYKTIEADHFAPKMEISFIDGDKRSTLCYEKVTWNIGGEEKGLRYGENPGQEAAHAMGADVEAELGRLATPEAGSAGEGAAPARSSRAASTPARRT